MRQKASIRLAVDSSAPVQAGQGCQGSILRLTIASLERDTLLFILKNSTRIRPTPLTPSNWSDTWLDGRYMELKRKLEGGRGRQCMANAALGPSYLTSFRLKNLHLSSSYVRQSPTTNDVGLTDDDTKTLPKTLPMIGDFLNASSKVLARTTNSKSSVSNARSGQVQCLPHFSACVWQSTGSACGTRPAPPSDGNNSSPDEQ